MTRTNAEFGGGLRKSDFDDIQRFGFLNQTETTLSFDGTDTFTLGSVGASWSYWRSGIKYTIAGSKTVQVASPMVDGTLYYIYIDSVDGSLTSSASAWTLDDTKVPVAVIYWNSTLTPKYQMSEERHTCLIDRRMHKYEHESEGTKYISGGTLAGYSVAPTSPTDAGNTFSISEATIADEDLYQTLAALTDPNGTNLDYLVAYRTSATTWAWNESAVPFKYTTTGYIEYDNAGTMTPLAQERAVNYYLAFCNIQGKGRYLLIPGRSTYATPANAYLESPTSLSFPGFFTNELVVLYQLTFETKASYTTKGLCRLTRIPQRVSTTLISSAVSSPTTDHNSLAGIQGGAANEYYHQTSAEYAASQAVPTTYLKLDGSNSPITGSLSQTLTTGANTPVNDITSTLTITDQDMTANRTSTGITNNITNNNPCSADWPSYNYIYGLSNIIFNSGAARLWQGVGILNQVSNTASDATYNEIKLSQGIYNYMYQNNANAVTTTVYGIDNYINNNAGTMTNATGMYIHFAGTIANKVGINVVGETSNSLSGSLSVGGNITGGNIPIAETSVMPIVSVPAQTSASTFVALINGTPTNVANSVVTFDTVTAGNVAVITPATTCMAKMKMYNVTRGNYALIVSATGSTFTVDRNVTTLAAPWANNDAIQITSSVMGGLGSLGWVDYELTTGLTGRASTFIKLQLTSTSTGADILRLHPYTSTTSTSKYDALVGVANITQNGFGLLSVINDSLCLSWTGTPSSFTVREAGYIT